MTMRVNHKTENVTTITTDLVMKALFFADAVGHVYGATKTTAQPVSLKSKTAYGDYAEYVSHNEVPFIIHASFGFAELCERATHIGVVAGDHQESCSEVNRIAKANPEWSAESVADQAIRLGISACTSADWFERYRYRPGKTLLLPR